MFVGFVLPSICLCYLENGQLLHNIGTNSGHFIWPQQWSFHLTTHWTALSLVFQHQCGSLGMSQGQWRNVRRPRVDRPASRLTIITLTTDWPLWTVLMNTVDVCLYWGTVVTLRMWLPCDGLVTVIAMQPWGIHRYIHALVHQPALGSALWGICVMTLGDDGVTVTGSWSWLRMPWQPTRLTACTGRCVCLSVWQFVTHPIACDIL